MFHAGFEKAHDVDDFGGLVGGFAISRGWSLSALGGAFFDPFEERFSVLIFVGSGVEIGGEGIDELTGNELFFVGDFDFVGGGDVFGFGLSDFVGVPEKVEHHGVSFCGEGSEIFAGSDDDFGDAEFFLIFEGFAEDHVSFASAFFGDKEVGFGEVGAVDLVFVDEFGDFDGLVGLNGDFIEICIGEGDEGAVFEFVRLDDVGPFDFFAGRFVDTLVADPGKVVFVDHVKADAIGGG